jgi:Ser/Thr protein kinase RdoA (MazF antagonist)
MEGKEYVADGEVYYCLYKRIDGKQMNPGKLGTSDYAVKARFIGEIVGWLDLAVEEVDTLAEEADMYAGVLNWAIPQLKDKMNLDKSFVKNYEETFGELYQKLPKQIIHRDPNPGNIILSEDKWGFIDFELSERNVRVFDPCYAATAILSETYVANDEHKMEEWVEIYQEILCGYDAVVKFTEEEKQAIPYVVISNQLLALAWFAGQERYRDIYELNCKMTEWILANFEKLQVE